ncbi:MAG: hypothetical protein HC808_15235 [Candidatus Competibacteraceae bacterium]|nr:hypothetical protein [Candidatus Competibacteraceae bacterium]
MAKDDSRDSFGFASTIDVEGVFGLYKDWMLVLRGGWDSTVRESSDSYDGLIFNAALTRRF